MILIVEIKKTIVSIVAIISPISIPSSHLTYINMGNAPYMDELPVYYIYL